MKNLSVAGIILLVLCNLSACITPEQQKEKEMENNIPNTELSGAVTFTSNSDGNKTLEGTPYGYEMWTQGGNNNKLIWYGPNQRGGTAFRTEWNNPNICLGRVGFYWGNGGKYTEYKNMYADFDFKRSGHNTAGNHSYIGIYGWARNPNAEKAEEKLIEYIISWKTGLAINGRTIPRQLLLTQQADKY
jgi:hypothetical protein